MKVWIRHHLMSQNVAHLQYLNVHVCIFHGNKKNISCVLNKTFFYLKLSNADNLSNV